MFNVKILLILSAFCCSTAIFAQKKIETFYFNADGDTVKTKAEASHYQVVQTSGKQRISTTFDIKDSADVKKSEIMYRRDKSATVLGDSVWWKYGLAREWYQSGQLKEESSYFFDRLQNDLKTYHPNGTLKRHDVYRLDTLVKGQCYALDSSEIAYIPYKEMPEFKGGLQKMFEYLGNNVKYDREARENSIEGIVYVGFVVSKTGEIENVKVRRGAHPLLDVEAVRVVKSMPKWKAGKQEGELVRVSYTLPIKFRLE